MHPLLLQTSLAELRRKLTRKDSPLAPWWRHFTGLARRDPVFYSPYTVLTALVTGAADDRELARQSFMRFVELKEEGYISNDAQYHTHVVAAPLARWAIFYDWIADEGILSTAEDKAVRQYFMDFGLLFPWEHATSRARQFDNQLMSNAFAAAVLGYIFGLKRGSSPAARRLYRSGLDVLRDLLNRIPAGGYSPEGSTYHENVVLPLTLMSALFLEETTGEKVRDLPLLLETSCRMIGPGGLMPAWDAYGYSPAAVKCGLAYLARLRRDPNPLAIIRACNMWYRTVLPAWDIDDRLWTLVFWPEDVDTGSATATFPPWLQPAVAGALQDEDTKLRLFQYWDECGGVPSSGRCQVNPNAITLEAFGSPILLDGHGHPGRAVIPLPAEVCRDYVGLRTLESIQEYIFSAWGGKPTIEECLNMALDGSIGMSNSLVFDEEYWYVPKVPRRGTGEELHAVGPLQVVRSECAEYYRDRYEVTSVTRTSVAVGGRYVLCTDQVTAGRPYALTWQAYVRQEAQLADGRVSLCTPEQVHCEIIPLQPGRLELLPIKDYPKIGDGRSALMRHTLAPAVSARVDVALVPQAGTREVKVLFRGLATAYLEDEGLPPCQERVYQETFTLTPRPGRRYFLVVPAAGIATRVTVNGDDISPTIPQGKGHWPGSAEALPLVFDVTSVLRRGSNGVALRPPFFHGEFVLGPVSLREQTPAEPVAIAARGDAAFSICISGDSDELLVENRVGLVPFAGGETDARHAVLTVYGQLAAADVTRLRCPQLGLALVCDAPCDLAWSPRETALVRWVSGCTLRLAWEQHELRVFTGGCVEIAYSGPGAHRLELRLDTPQNVIVNGRSLGIRQGTAVKLTLKPATTWQPVAAPEEPSGAEALDAVFSLLNAPRDTAVTRVLQALSDPDWRVQEAAADVAGQLQIREAVPRLLELFEMGEKELPYPAIKTWWRGSKMLRTPHAIEGDDPDMPRPLGVKRWRLQRAVTTALGKIGDRRAVAPLEAALTRCTDFFPVTSMLPVALGRLGATSCIPILQRHWNHAEINTRLHARLALRLLEGEIGRAEFETKVGMV